jgi:hypothetical protein
MSWVITRLKCLLYGHWESKVGLYILDEKTAMVYERPGCLRCRKVFRDR